MRHELLTQHDLFCIGVNAKKGMLSQHFVTHVVPPLVALHGNTSQRAWGRGYSQHSQLASTPGPPTPIRPVLALATGVKILDRLDLLKVGLDP